MGLQDDEQVDAAIPDDDGLYYPLDYVIETYDVFRNFGVMPESGGYNDQDPHWWHDIRTIQRRISLIKSRLRNELDEKDVFEGLLPSGDDTPTDWRDVING